MSGKSNYLESMILESLFRNGTFTKPTTIYVALYSTDPTDADTGTELTGGGYARVAVTNAATEWEALTDDAGYQRTSNVNPIVFTESTAAQGNATHFGLRTAATAGNLLYGDVLSPARNVDSAGITVRIPADGLVIREG